MHEDRLGVLRGRQLGQQRADVPTIRGRTQEADDTIDDDRVVVRARHDFVGLDEGGGQ